MNSKRGYYSTEIGGKERGMRFNMNFWAEFTDSLGIKLDQLGTVFDGGISLSGIRSLIYSALVTYDREQKNPIDYDEYDVGSWLDDFDSNEIEKVINAMMDSKILGNDLNMGIERNPKTPQKKTKA